MRKAFLLSILGSVLSVGANAGTIVLTFEGLQDKEAVDNYYNGGSGGAGSGPGPSDGITFSSNALATIEKADGGSGHFAEEPSPDTTLYFLNGSAATMDVSAGFTNGFSLYYSSPAYAGSVDIWSGLNDTGTLLATLALPTTPDAGNAGCGGMDYCPFVQAGVAFSGTAESVEFIGTQNSIGFDNVTLGSSGTSPVPEPASAGLLAFGVAALIARSLRQRQLQ